MRLVVFDMDGTLIDTQGLIAEHMGSAFTGMGLAAPTPAEVRTIIGLSLPIAVGRLADTADEALVAGLVDLYKSHYRASLERDSGREPLYAGAQEALDRLRVDPETILGIATGKGLAGAERILKHHGLSAYFATVQTPDHNPSKPHPGMLLRAMAETGARADETVMIGDTVFDIDLANAAGVMSIGVGWGYHAAADLERAGATQMIESYDALDDALRKVFG